MPALDFAVFRVHAEKVASKEGCLVTTCTTTNFECHIFAVFRIGRDEQELDFLFQFGDTLLVHGNLLACHLFHLWVILHRKHLLCLFQSLDGIDVFLAGTHDVLKVLVFLGQLHITLLVGNDVGVSDEGRDLLKSRHQPFQFFQYFH